jgi:hypothetical protein
MKIVATNNSGLGNRIKCLLSCLKVDPNAGVYWAEVPGVFSCPLSELFTNKIPHLTEAEARSKPQYSSWRFIPHPYEAIPQGFCIVTAGEDRIGRKFSGTRADGRNFDLEFERIPEQMKTEYVQMFNSLDVHPKVQAWVDEASLSFDEKTVSVHIRSWEDQDPDEESRLRQKHFFNLNNFITEMDKFETDVKFFVCSDSVGIIKKLKKIYGNRILTYKRHSPLETSRSTIVGGQDDLTELLLLSKNDKILGSYISTFTEVAWWFGGAKAKVIIC